MPHVWLALRLLAAHPTLDASAAYRHADAAIAAATARVKPELLLAIAFTETKLDAMALSRVEGGQRRVDRWESREPPKRWRKGTSLFCGPLQTQARTWDECLAQRDLPTAYATGVKEIEQWLDEPVGRGNLARALAGFGCGTEGARAGTCSNAFEARVLGRARELAD